MTFPDELSPATGGECSTRAAPYLRVRGGGYSCPLPPTTSPPFPFPITFIFYPEFFSEYISYRLNNLYIDPLFLPCLSDIFHQTALL